MTDLPRLLTVKEENPSNVLASASSLKDAHLASLSVKAECVFVSRPAIYVRGDEVGTSMRTPSKSGSGAGKKDEKVLDGKGDGNSVIEVFEKGAKGFSVQTVSR